MSNLTYVGGQGSQVSGVVVHLADGVTDLKFAATSAGNATFKCEFLKQLNAGGAGVEVSDELSIDAGEVTVEIPLETGDKALAVSCIANGAVESYGDITVNGAVVTDDEKAVYFTDGDELSATISAYSSAAEGESEGGVHIEFKTEAEAFTQISYTFVGATQLEGDNCTVSVGGAEVTSTFTASEHNNGFTLNGTFAAGEYTVACPTVVITSAGATFNSTYGVQQVTISTDDAAVESFSQFLEFKTNDETTDDTTTDDTTTDDTTTDDTTTDDTTTDDTTTDDTTTDDTTTDDTTTDDTTTDDTTTDDTTTDDTTTDDTTTDDTTTDDTTTDDTTTDDTTTDDTTTDDTTTDDTTTDDTTTDDTTDATTSGVSKYATAFATVTVAVAAVAAFVF